ncbi:MAG: DUF11 domain-containing protein [Betaproteobacteria bacterium]|nr:DUF11 domain-containing protein [Betaproteobacteria bacterium]
MKLTNPWRAATRAVTGATATLSTTTPGITIYDNSATWGAIAPQGTATGDPFTFTVDPAVAAGTAIDFTLDIVSNIGSSSVKFRIRVGTRNGTDPAITYTGTPAPALTILSNRPRGVFHQIDIADDYEIADLDFRIDSITTTAAGDLTAMLRSPQGIGVDLITLIDGLNDLGGTSIAGMVIDDDVAAIAANDMVQATLADSPYTKSWLPAYNSPWAAVVDADLPADPVGALSRYDGMSTLGTWSAHVADVWSAASGGRDGNGAFGGWSMIVTPVHFDVAGFVPGVALTASKTVAGTFRVGQNVTYTVTLTNTGTANQADNAGNEFTDVLPAGLTLAGATASSGTALATVGTNTVTWNGSLAPLGGSVVITITATINAGALGATISNQGTVAYDADAMDGSNEATLLTDDPAIAGAADPTSFVVQNANLTGTKTVSGATFAAGSTVTYTVVLFNTGAAGSLDNAGNEFTDVLPATLVLVSASATVGNAMAAIGANTVTWNGSVAAGGSVTITITATVAPGTPIATLVSNQGAISFDADFDGTNETARVTDDPGVGGASDATVFTTRGALLTATKNVSGHTFAPGDLVTYTIVLTNTGNAAAPDSAGNELTDVLPAGLALASASATAGTAVASPGTNTVTWNGSVPAGGSVTLTIGATVNANATGALSNQGTVLYDADLDGSNETTAITDDPRTPGAAQDATIVFVQARAIPALGMAGMAILGFALLGLAGMALRRRSGRSGG